MSSVSPSFPVMDLVPRNETNALEFLKQHPDCNGNKVVIGILDTGIDPGAAGIRYMEDGKTPKLVDLVDCTGSGDVDVSTVVTVNDQYQVPGLSGRTLQLDKNWWKLKEQEQGPGQPLPSVHLGIKRAYELFPESLVNRVKAHRKKELDKCLNRYMSDIRQQLSDWQQSMDKEITTTTTTTATSTTNNGDTGTKPTADQLRQRDDLQARMDALADKEWDDDPGIILDCVVFFDGQDHRAVILGDTTDNPTSISPLAAFSKERQYGTISTVDQYNFGVNFYDDAKVLSIVGDCTPHGTHVAAIAAAAEGDRSGVAPGAQLISIKIGDSRMGSMETGSSIARGIITAVQLGCDVINLSYGEGCQLPNAGRVIQFAQELVWRHNIVFVSAVGNNGPALTTVNAPGGMSSCILGVAAYVSPEMMKAEYSLKSNSDQDEDEQEQTDEPNTNTNTNALVGTTYTWSSVGPAADGSNGVCLCAPGGAITSVSNWTMQKSMLMNGTSMASPHACGCVALLLSACKQEGIPISPSRIQRALENSAKPMPNLTCLQQGWGMIQVDQAYEHLKATKDIPEQDIHFEVVVDNRSGNPRGIYLRQPNESLQKQTFSIRVNPNFRRVDKIDEGSQRSRIKFEMQFAITSTASWINAPDHFMLMHNGRSFKISVDPTKLPHGVHTAKVCGSDAEHPERGVMWSVPITVVKPMETKPLIEWNALEFQATEIKRFFVVPPTGATWMDVTIRDGRKSSDTGTSASTRLYVLHTVQLIPHAAYRDYAQQKYLNLLPSQTSVTSIAVEAGVTCEIDIGRYWSSAGITKADVSVEFRGIQPVPAVLSMNSGDCFGLVQIHSFVKDETINPSAKLNKWKTPLRPKAEGVITPLGERDVQPWSEKKTYQLVLTYEFTMDEKGVFTPRAPPLQDVLYESIYESQIMLAYDGDKKYLGYCDAYAHSITAPKGTVVIKMQVRHDDPAMLDKLKDMTIWIERKLDKEVPLSAYATREDLLIGGNKRSIRKRTLRKGMGASVFFSEPASSSKLPSSCKAGDILMGTAYYASGEASLPGDGKRPGGFPISYTLGPKMENKPAASEAEVAEPKDERTPEQRLSEAIRDLKVDLLGKLTSAEKDSGKFEEIYAELWKEYPSHVPLLMTNLKCLDGLKKRSEILPQIVEAADKVIAQISEDELALHFGKKLDKDDPEKVKRNKELEKKKSHLIEALVRQAHAFCEMKTDEAPSKFDKTLDKLKAWVDIDSNGKYAALAIERDCRASRYGLALKRINKLLTKNGKDSGGIKPLTKADLFEKRCEIFKQLGYDALVKRDQAMRLVAAPNDYKLF